VSRFLRYFCFYCASRFIYSAVRNHQRRAAGARPAAPPACTHFPYGFVAGLLVGAGGLLGGFVALCWYMGGR
jgi:uncharacterized membrane protein YfcA